MGFSAPDGWREVARTDTDSTSFVAFVVPRPSADPSAPAGNVMIEVTLSHDHRGLKTFSDGKISQVRDGPGDPVLVDSHYWPDSTRTIHWSGVLHGTPYLLWDKHAVRDSIYVDIRTAIPSSYSRDPRWQAQYDANLALFIGTVCVGGRPLFPVSTSLCPDIQHVLPFSPGENEDGARFVWLIERHNGFPRPYVSAADLPNSSDYREVEGDSARAGDVVRWPSVVGIYDAEEHQVLLLEGGQPLASFIQRLGAPRYFRRLVPQ